MPHVLAQDLRNAVLQAAIQGKLTTQLSTDQPVSLLLKNIQKEKEHLITDKIIKREKPLPPIDEEEIPFDIPDSWSWVRMPDISLKITDGTHHSPINSSVGDYMYVTAKNIKDDGVDLKNITYVSEKVHKEIYSRCNPEYGDILYIKDGATTGIVTINNVSEPFSLLSSVALIKLGSSINNKYVMYAMRSPIFYGKTRDLMQGTGITRITLTVISNLIFPLPPIEEQARIVARVDELMAKIDEYEKIEKELTELQKAFPGAMKDAILQAAMQGKLTEQLESDDDVYKLCSDISVKDKKWKPIEEDETPFTIPDNWEWMRLREFSSITAGGTPNRSEPKYWNGDIPWLKIGNMTSKYVTEADEFITEDGLNNSSAKWVKKGTILYSIFASIGTVAILDFEATTNQAIAAVTINERINRDYMYYVLTALKSVLVGQGHGMAQMNINQEILKNTPIPIPPIEEQQRIVDKLDQLLPLCEQLEKSIA